MARPTPTRKAEILTIRQVALYLQVTERTIYRLAASDGIPAFKVGGSWRFRLSDLDYWIESQTGKASAENSLSGGASPKTTALPVRTKSKQAAAMPANRGFAIRDAAQ